MKNMIIILSMLCLFTNCDNEKQTEPQENSIYGTWQLTKRFHVLPSSVEVIENGEKITFRENGEFYSASFPCKGLFEKKGIPWLKLVFNDVIRFHFFTLI